MNFAPAAGYPATASKYCRYYGIDFEEQFSDLDHGLGYFSSLDYRLCLHYYQQQARSRGTVFILHGYFDHTGLYGHLIRYLIERQFNVVSYDLPGHGLSTGDRAAITSFKEYRQILSDCIDLCRDQFPGPWFAVGQSTGGAVIMDHLLHPPPLGRTTPFQEVVLLAPLVRPVRWDHARLAYLLAKPFVKTWRRVYSQNSSDSAFLRFIRDHDPLQPEYLSMAWMGALKAWVRKVEAAKPVDYPVTVIQGKRDKTVDWRHNIPVISSKFREAQVHYLDEGRHHLVNESVEIRTRIFAILDDHFHSGKGD